MSDVRTAAFARVSPAVTGLALGVLALGPGLGCAALRWGLRALAAGLGDWRSVARLCVALVPAAIGGFTAISVSSLVAVPAAFLAPVNRVAAAGAASSPDGPGAVKPRAAPAGWRRRARTVALVLLVLAAASLPWLIPALARPIHTSATAVAASAARADTPSASLATLLLLGVTWNAQTVPARHGGGAAVLWLIPAPAGGAGYVARARRDPPGPL